MHSNVIKRIKIVSKVLSRDLLNTKFKFLVPLSIVPTCEKTDSPWRYLQFRTVAGSRYPNALGHFFKTKLS